jgi:predicted HAD superfamily hydrolase
MRTIRDISNDLLKDKDFGNPKSLEELGYIFFGPLVFNYLFWLKDEIKDGDLILFNSREGYFLNQIYQLFFLQGLNHLEIYYF